MSYFTKPSCLIAYLATAIITTGPAIAAIPNSSGSKNIPVIDIHTHIFNARDLPLLGILRSRNVPKPIASIIAEALLQTTDENELVTTSAAILATKVEEPKIALTEKNRAALLKYTEDVNDDVSLSSIVNADTLLIAKALQKANFPPQESESDGGNLLSAGDSPRGGLAGYARFIGIMRQSHENVARYLQEIAYPQVDLFLHHMMDMENAYATTPKTPFTRQIQQMEKADLQSGNLLHFVAFDPFRGEGDSLEMVKKGIAEGAIGVKFYPPSGYRAADNFIPPKPKGFFSSYERKQWRSQYGNLSGKKLDKIIDDFFSWASKNDIPVFTHCTPEGFEAVGGYGLRGDPYFWSRAKDVIP